jgi:transcriptional regulator with XRE-family HTH domain
MEILLMSNNLFLDLLSQTHTDSGLSIRTVAERSGIDHTAVMRILRGERTPRRDTLLAICLCGWDLDRVETNEILKIGGFPLLCEKGA